MKAIANSPVLYINRKALLKDNDQWTNRFEIHSETSNNVYIIAQNKSKKHWACSCKGWIFHRKCKHLEALNLPFYSVPFEPVIANSIADYKKLINSKNVLA